MLAKCSQPGSGRVTITEQYNLSSRADIELIVASEGPKPTRRANGPGDIILSVATR
jgi:hypothetical protein